MWWQQSYKGGISIAIQGKKKKTLSEREKEVERRMLAQVTEKVEHKRRERVTLRMNDGVGVMLGRGRGYLKGGGRKVLLHGRGFK